MNNKIETPKEFQANKITSEEQIVQAMNDRINSLENEVENLKKEQMRNNIQYNKHFKMKHATRAMECANKIVSVKRKIDKYKKLIIKQKEKKCLNTTEKVT